MSEDFETMLDVRELAEDEGPELEDIATTALYHPHHIVRQNAIGHLKTMCPDIVGCYATNRIILILKGCGSDELTLGYLADVREPQRSLASHPFFGND